MINFSKYWSYKIVKIIIGLLSVTIIYNIYTTIEYNIRRSILEDIKLESQKDSLTLRLKSMMQDTVLKWQKQNLNFTLDYNKREKWYWEDIVVFNKERTRGFSFYYKIDTSKGKNVCDAVEYYLVNKIKNGSWRFYFPNQALGFCRMDDYFEPPYNKEKMQNFMYEDLAEKYVIISEKQIDKKIVEDWFKEYSGDPSFKNAMKEE